MQTKDEKPVSQELAAARADNPAPFGNKGFLSADDVKPMDRAAKSAIRALQKANQNMITRNFGKDTREFVLLALLEIETLRVFMNRKNL